jgi:signal transduction histidine kinase
MVFRSAERDHRVIADPFSRYQRQRPARRQRWHHRGPLFRSREDRRLAGVAGGLARRTGIDVTLLRIALVITALVSGFGLVFYVIAWLLFPLEGEQRSIGARVLADRKGLVVAVALLPVLVAILTISSALDAGFLSSIAWAGYLAAAGLFLVYRNADEDERAWLRLAVSPVLGSPSRWSLALRGFAGLSLLGGGAALLIYGHFQRASLEPLAGVALMIFAVVVIFGPWWLRLTRDLVSERQARIRAEERADVAASVHDSVLQTLALIQRSATEPERVVQLARGQERDLRSWLFEGRTPGAFDAEGATSLVAAVEQMAHEVEGAHRVRVDVVAVGDCPLDADLRVMLAAGREAMVNAAKWSGAPTVSLFTEVDSKRVSVFVRDRGSGFDPDAAPSDRHGIATSIRMDRVGGRVNIRSTLGEGSEVELSVPRRNG